MRDISERKRAEEAIRQSEQRLRTFFASDMVGMIFWNMDGKITDANDKFLRMIGYSREDLANGAVKWSDITPAEYHSIDQQAIKLLKETGVDSPYEKEYIRKDGTRVPIIIGAAMLDEKRYDGVAFVLDITERKQAEVSLQASRQMLETVVNYLPASVNLMRGDDLRLILINPAYQAIAPGKVMVGKTLEELWPETGQDFTALCRHVLQTGEPYHVVDERNTIRRSPDGPLEEAFFSWSLHRVQLPGDGGWGILNTAWETTERKRTEEALRESTERLFWALQAARGGAWDWDLITGKAWWSQEMYDLWGVQPGTVMTTENSLSLIDERDRQRITKEIDDQLAKKADLRYEFRIHHSTLGERWMETRARAIYDTSTEKPVRIIGITLDITERREIEEALRQSEDRFRTLANNIAQLAWMADEKGWIFWYNKRWFDYTGTTLDEMKGWGWQKVHHPDHIDRVVKRFREAIETAEYWEDTFPLRGSDGQYRWFLSRAIPIKDSSGNITRWFGTNTDITQLRDTEEELRALKDELELRVQQRTQELLELNNELEAFSYSVSHDLRTPLILISGYVDLLKRRAAALDEKSTHYLTTIGNVSRDMGNLIDDLLALSRVGRTEMKSAPVDFKHLAEEVIDSLTSQRKDQRIQCAINNLPTVFGDQGLLRIILTNLISNAIKYSRGKEQIHLIVDSTGQNNGMATCFVRDNGVGFDMKYAHKLFGVFQRLHTESEFEGTGIGLAIVRRIVTRHGGRIWAEGHVGKGATFYFTLPTKPFHTNNNSPWTESDGSSSQRTTSEASS